MIERVSDEMPFQYVESVNKGILPGYDAGVLLINRYRTEQSKRPCGWVLEIRVRKIIGGKKYGMNIRIGKGEIKKACTDVIKDTVTMMCNQIDTGLRGAGVLPKNTVVWTDECTEFDFEKVKEAFDHVKHSEGLPDLHGDIHPDHSGTDADPDQTGKEAKSGT